MVKLLVLIDFPVPLVCIDLVLEEVEMESSVISLPLKMKPIKPEWTEETLLSQKGWFYLNEIFQILDPEDTGKYKLTFKLIQRLIDQGADPYEIMGRRKFGGRVGVQMEKFAVWYSENPLLKAQKLDGSLPFEEFLISQGYYRLSEICKFYCNHIPYSYSILKRTADKNLAPQEQIGIFKYDTTYLVTLPRFREWLKMQLFS